MALTLGQFDVMSHLWATLEKTADGLHIRYTIADIDLLWDMGFVDTQRYTKEQWRAVFEPYAQGDGGFLLGHDAFMALGNYRYLGEIRVPFDAMRINEGQYTDEGLGELFRQSIAPSYSLSAAELSQFFEKIKKQFRMPNGLIRIGKDAKLKIKKLLDDHPSPLRNLEILFDRMLAQGLDPATAEQFGNMEKAKANRARQDSSSRFSQKATSQGEAHALALKAITKAKEKKTSAGSGGGKLVELKKVKRSKKGIRT